MKNEYKKYTIVMILCFLLGGFSIIFFLSQLYSEIWAKEVLSDFRNSSNYSKGNFTDSEFNRSPPRERVPVTTPFERVSAPFSIMLLINGIILIAGGLSLWSITREKEIAKTKENITSLLLQPEEKIIIDEIRKARGDITQSQLVKKTGMNKVKIHRIIRRLSAKGIISKHEYGLTNKIVLEKNFG